MDAELKGSEERVGDFVGCEEDSRVLLETSGEQVAERVVLLVECEDGRVGNACLRSRVSGGVPK